MVTIYQNVKSDFNDRLWAGVSTLSLGQGLLSDSAFASLLCGDRCRFTLGHLSSQESIMEVRKLSEVFKTVGLPPYTYVKPAYFGEVRSDIEQPGKHVLIEGPSGIGKTCIVFKVFEEIGWEKDRDFSYISGRDPDAIQKIEIFILEAKSKNVPFPPTIVIDDFHILPEQFRVDSGSELKRISDIVFEHSFPSKFILIGIPAAGVTLLASANDLGPRLGSYRLKRAEDSEIRRVIEECEQELNIIFEDSDVILSESSGNFWLAQFVCNKICSINNLHETKPEITIIHADLLAIRRRLMEELSNRFLPIAKTFAKGKKWRPGGNKPYLEILLSLAKIPELIVPFDAILSVVPERRRPGIKAVRSRVKEVLFDPDKNVDLRKQIAFEDAGFSIEGPLFRYYLSNMNPSDLLRELGIGKDATEIENIYTYDIGFSFAGEVRLIVDIINNELKSEDVVTFYDFDQQAFLLAENLEEVIKRVYKESCRYYIVFIEHNYARKVWTNYERDIMTQPGRSRHIIPVYLEKPSETRLVGVPGVTGMIDLSEVWRHISATGKIDEGARATIRNRLVLPIIEKIDATYQDF